MTNETLIYLFRVTFSTFNRNLGGITHEESLQSPHSGSSVNWIAGHLLLTRGQILQRLDETPELPMEELKMYERYSAGIAENPMPLEQIITLFAKTQDHLLTTLHAKELSPEVFKQTAFLQFHEAYHCGQLGIMRRVLGKSGAI